MDPVIVPATELIIVPVREHIVKRIKNAIHFEDNFKKVKEGLEHLEAKRIDIQREIEEDKISTTPTEECKHWLGKVDEIMKKVKDMIVQINDLKEKYRDKRCFILCHGVGYRMKLGNKLVSLISSIKECKDEPKFQRVIKTIPKVEKIFTPTLVDETSSHKKMQEILSYIRDEETYKIGVWGPGGVGKTTLIQNLNNLPELVEKFDIIIWVTIAKDSLKDSQNKIARRLKVNVDNETDNIIINKLSEKLETMKFLLFLDDVWEFFKLEDLGVPGTDLKKKGSKVVLTTRNERVCDRMRTGKKVHVDYLKEEEAWELFCREAYLEWDPDSNQKVEQLARDVAKECGRLPLAITVVGAAMRGKKEIYEWESALGGLQSQDSSKIEDMEEKVFTILRWSYDRLSDEETKKCFLYFALFPEDYKIESGQLINYWWNEGYIVINREIVEDIEKARIEGQVILKNLLYASLLQHKGSNLIKMHDLLRDLALKVASDEGHNFIVKHGNEVKELKDAEWEKGRKISLMSCGIASLPHEPKCPMLTTLLLQLKEGLPKIPDLFFSQMTSLQVLDLSGSKIELLPASLDSLANLRALYLTNTCLKALPDKPNLPKLSSLFLKDNLWLETIPDSFFEQMPTLTILDLSDTKIIVLPSSISCIKRLQILVLRCPYLKSLSLDMGKLDNLVDLDLSGVHNSAAASSRKIPSGILSKLKKLKRLIIHPDSWQVEEGATKEVASLENITELTWHFSLDDFKYFVDHSKPWKQGTLNSFSLDVVGPLNSFSLDVLVRPRGYRFPHLLCSHISRLHRCAPPSQRHISFFKCNGLNALNFSRGSMTKLESLKVKDCDAIETFISKNRVFGSATDTDTDDTFQHLEKLALKRMRDLKSFYQGKDSLSPVKFHSLKILVLKRCPVLKELLSLALLQKLTSLEELIVESCDQIEQIITDDEGGEDGVIEQKQVEIPKLKKLVLDSLPSLVRFCPEDISFACCFLESICVQNCDNLKCLPLGIPDAPNLRKIECDNEWWNALKMDSNTKQRLQQLTDIRYEIGSGVRWLDLRSFSFPARVTSTFVVSNHQFSDGKYYDI